MVKSPYFGWLNALLGSQADEVWSPHSSPHLGRLVVGALGFLKVLEAALQDINGFGNIQCFWGLSIYLWLLNVINGH
jgi:hypothetical protein